MTKKTLQELREEYATLPPRSRRGLWVRWRILNATHTINRTLIVCGVLGAFSAGMIVRHVETVDDRARERDADRLEVDTARQLYDTQFALFEAEHDDWRDCGRSVEGRANFRLFINTIIDGLVEVTNPESESVRVFIGRLTTLRDTSFQEINPASCGEEPTPPALPDVLAELGESPSTTTTLPPATSG
jgi:hypothetical protein